VDIQIGVGLFQLSSNSMPNFQATLIVDGIQIQSIHPTMSVNFQATPNIKG